MKRHVLYFLALLISAGVVAQNLQPVSGKFYTIKQKSSQLVIGADLTQPAVQTPTGHRSQAFEFIAVDGQPNVYYLKNRSGMYLNKFAAESWNYWTSIYESNTNGQYSEWMLEGEDFTDFRLKLTQNSLYLSTDTILENSALYVDKDALHRHGRFELLDAPSEPTPVFSVFDKNVVLEIEEEQTYLYIIKAEDFLDDIEITISEGFEILNPVYSPSDFADGGGSVFVEIVLDGAQVGDTGKMIFSYERFGIVHYLDTVLVTKSPEYKRYNIVHVASGLVIGKQSTSAFPALTENVGDVTQQFILREVNPGANDSIYYFVQDVGYKMFRKVTTSGWDTEFGVSGSNAQWKLTKTANGTYTFTNQANNRVLGTDSNNPNSRLYADKTHVIGGRTEWLIEESMAMNDEVSSFRNVSLSRGLLNKAFDSAVTAYDVLAPADADTISITAAAISPLMSLEGSPAIITPASPTATLTGISGNGASQTSYVFNWKPITFSQWDADGAVLSTRSVPSMWGWKSSTTALWVAANSTTAGSMRYIDNPANYKYNGEAGWMGRILYLRWDGTVTVDGVFSFPVVLEAGKSYSFSGKYAWNSVVPAGAETAEFTIGINTTSDNTGVPIASELFSCDATDLLNLKDASFEFVAPVSGVFYLTIANNTALLAAFADLSITAPTSVPSLVQSPVYAYTQNNQIVVAGAAVNDEIRIYSMGGQLIEQRTVTSGTTHFTLEAGVYIIKTNDAVVKVVK